MTIDDDIILRAISLGAGVQSTILALKAARGEIIPMPHCAIFADTAAEPIGVYRHLDWLEKQLPFPVYRVIWKDGLTKNIEKSVAGGRFAGAPFYAGPGTRQVPVDHDNPDAGMMTVETEGGPLNRQCTREFKIQPIVRKVRELVGLPFGKQGPRKKILVEQWIGISMDESIRMKPSRISWIRHRWPLIEQQMTRRDCLKWAEERQYPTPPRSACVYCPYKSDYEWRLLRDTDPAGWDEAVRVDAMVRTGIRGVKDPLFVHRSLKPLPEVDLTTAEDRGQLNLFLNECEGMCGV